MEMHSTKYGRMQRLLRCLSTYRSKSSRQVSSRQACHGAARKWGLFVATWSMVIIWRFWWIMWWLYGGSMWLRRGNPPQKKKLGFQSIGGKTWTGNQIWGFPVKMLNCSYHLILGMMEGSDIPFPWKHAQSNWSTSRKKNMTLRQTFSSRHIDNPRPGCFCDMLTSTLR